jgi:hypothetical protein
LKVKFVPLCTPFIDLEKHLFLITIITAKPLIGFYPFLTPKG